MHININIKAAKNKRKYCNHVCNDMIYKFALTKSRTMTNTKNN